VTVIFFADSTPAFSQGVGWSIVNAKIRHDFPDVPRISTNELADWLSSKREKPLLLDVRTAAEFGVSHLEGAKRIEPGADAKAISTPKDRPIVTYCSVGYRSALFAKKLREAGYTRVANLEGSIFRWANENRPLQHDAERTDKVHPYNKVWGLLLEKPHRAINPPPP
ncbi:MAG TPA: rhodanese-like domain-containing protein, partial [Chthoniobacterales bacterium]